jgi:ribosome-associated toxin RatA of RatAB toxin-antitoxin module
MHVNKIVLAQFSAERMFDLIEGAEHYPSFLPWCAEAKIVERDNTLVVADVTVDYHGVRFQFRTRNPKRPPEWMALRMEHGPFRHFEGEWNLRPLGTEGCRIAFELRYDFKSTLMSKLAGPVFDRIANTLVDAFVARADAVYRNAAAPVAPSPSASVAPAPAAIAVPAPAAAIGAAAGPPSAPAVAEPTPTPDPAIPRADPNRSESP